MMTTLDNTSPRTDACGRVIDCHDGCLRFYEGRFYLYGTRYGDTDGFTKANRYTVYSSPDLSHWTDHGDLLQTPLDGVCYRPYVIADTLRGRYVLWFNWYPKLWHGCFGVAVADRPDGPFKVIHESVGVAQPDPGDHNVFVDDDGAGYLIYTSIPGDEHTHHGMSVERLTDDLTQSTGENTGFIDHRVEAPAMFKRNNIYYCVFGNTCCFCPQGAGARVYRAQSPMGPWHFVDDINRDDQGRFIVPGQQTDITRLPTAHGPTYLWMADLWESRSDGVKGHDRQHWEPLSFDQNGNPRKLQSLKRFIIEPRVTSPDITPARPTDMTQGTV